MQDNKAAAVEDIERENDPHSCIKELKPGCHLAFTSILGNEKNETENTEKVPHPHRKAPFQKNIPVMYNYFTLVILGLFTWGLLWCLFGEGWAWSGQWLKMATVAAIAWASGQLLEGLTSLPPFLAALLTGILCKNIGFLNMHQYTEIDLFLRKIYPVIILGKASLGWNLTFMRKNWLRIATVGALPWLAEILVVCLCAHLFLGFPLIWGFLLGAAYASLSLAVVMSSVVRISSRVNSSRNWPQLVCAAGGTDLALSVSIYGLLLSFIFYDTVDTYRYVKAIFAIPVGVIIGVIIGSIAGIIPHSSDIYITELRISIVVLGGLLANAFTLLVGWGGAGGIAVLVCNATAAWFWSHDGWQLNNNPASGAYRVMWSVLEPMVFAYSGTFLDINSSLTKVLIPGFGVLALSLFVRLSVLCLTCWSFTIKEKTFLCCTWIPKGIVQAVLCPMAINTVVVLQHRDSAEMEYAVNIMQLLIQAILITTPLGFLLTKYVGPILLKGQPKDCENNETSQERL